MRSFLGDSVLDVLCFGWGFAGVLKDRIFSKKSLSFTH
jgi:hypothetical protein